VFCKLVKFQPDGIVTFDKLRQVENVDAIVILAPTVVGNVISCKLEQVKNAEFIVVKLGIDVGIIQLDNELQDWNIDAIVEASKLVGKINDLRPKQLLNILAEENTVPAATVVGIFTYSKEVQALNILVVVIDVAPDVNDGISIVIKLLQLLKAKV
jgi:hypothetical protein